MKIKSLRLKNFKSFENERYFNFETNGEKNIILIGGKNGAGKSSLFEAMKLCIYGPLTYRYQGFVSNYISRIKSYMNYNVFKNENVHAFVELEIYFNVDGEENLYKLKREWTYESHRLKEEFMVWKEEELLEDEDLDYFSSYLKNNVPPDIFDLFFFDGEQLSEFFIGRNSDLRLKETLLTLCNYDNFEILRKELLANKRNRHRQNPDLEKYSIKLVEIEEELETRYERFDTVEFEINNKISEIEDLNIEHENLYEEFNKAGGIFSAEREKLHGRVNYLENLRSEINQQIKDYCNETLPFIMLEDMLLDLKDQLYLEEEYIAYEKLQQKLSYEKLSNILLSTLGNNMINESDMDLLIEKISDQVFPKEIEDDFNPIHLISKGEQKDIIFIIDKIMNENISERDYFQQLKIIGKEINDIRQVLDSSLEDDEQEFYIKEMERINRSLLNKELEFKGLKDEKLNLKEDIDLMEREKERVEDHIRLYKQSSNIEDMLDKMIDMLENMISLATADKIVEVEKYFEDVFKKLITKDRFIDFIEVEEDFSITLYVKKDYSVDELIKLVVNVGLEDIKRRYGNRFIKGLKKIYGDHNKLRLLELMNMDDRNKQYSMDTKVDILGLSSGEKQIYILCLYWALIKTSKVNLPFVIDTPYGRIDEQHRTAITTNYFPNISDQVIVFSTNTEIDEDLYPVINPYIAREYLLEYDTRRRKTNVKKGYFYEVNLWDIDSKHQRKQSLSLRA